MAETFTWLPDDKPNGSVDFRLRAIRFGDGYQQIAKDGINTRMQKWPLNFDRSATEAEAIADFLDANEAAWFYWTPPGVNAVEGKYICTGYSKTPYSFDNEKISATFEEFIKP